MLPPLLKTSLLALILLAGFAVLNPLPAQDAPASAPAAEGAPADASADPAKKGTEAVTMMQFLAQGGSVMWFLGFASVCVEEAVDWAREGSCRAGFAGAAKISPTDWLLVE